MDRKKINSYHIRFRDDNFEVVTGILKFGTKNDEVIVDLIVEDSNGTLVFYTSLDQVKFIVKVDGE